MYFVEHFLKTFERFCTPIAEAWLNAILVQEA
jgi:hypothetical protein